MERVRIAAVRYLNTVPLVEGLAKLSDLDLTVAAPSHIAGMVRRGEADIGLASVIDAARGEPPLAMLPVGMIGCEGPTLTVRVFSEVPLDRVKRLHADTDSHTSVALARIVFDKRFGIRPEVVPFDARERVEVQAARGSAGIAARPGQSLDDAWPQTVLLIGDKVVSDAPPKERYPHQLDLGEAWYELTGLPFVYAVWMCRAGEEETVRIRSAAGLLDRQLRHNLTRMNWIVAARAPEHRWPVETAGRYLGTLLRYRVGDRERQAAALFLDEAERLGIVGAARPVWADLSAHPALV